MTVLLIEGFDYYAGSGAGNANARVTDIWANTSATLQTGRFAGLAMLQAGSSQCAWRVVGPWAGPSFGVGFAVSKQIAALASERLVQLWEDAGATTLQLMLAITSTGGLQVCRSTTVGTNVLCTSAAGLLTAPDLSWHYIEFETTLHDTTGSVSVKLDGVVVCSATNVDTKGGTTTTVAALGVGGTGWYGIIDDLYVTDGAALGERKIVTLRPTADTAQKQWAASTGSSNYALVDEAQANIDTDYISTSTAADYDLYDLGNLGFTPTSVDAVQIKMAARKDDAATRTVRTKMKSGATTSDGATRALSSSYTWTESLYPTNPNTAGAWSGATVDALQVGVQCVS